MVPTYSPTHTSIPPFRTSRAFAAGWWCTRFIPLDGPLFFKQIELNTRNSTKRRLTAPFRCFWCSTRPLADTRNKLVPNLIIMITCISALGTKFFKKVSPNSKKHLWIYSIKMMSFRGCLLESFTSYRWNNYSDDNLICTNSFLVSAEGRAEYQKLKVEFLVFNSIYLKKSDSVSMGRHVSGEHQYPLCPILKLNVVFSSWKDFHFFCWNTVITFL